SVSASIQIPGLSAVHVVVASGCSNTRVRSYTGILPLAADTANQCPSGDRLAAVSGRSPRPHAVRVACRLDRGSSSARQVCLRSAVGYTRARISRPLAAGPYTTSTLVITFQDGTYRPRDGTHRS